MAIADYLQGISNATSGEKTDVKTASADLAALQEGAGALPAKLKEALNLKLNNNKDLINQQADTMQNYFNSGAQSRAKYQDVFNPFEKAKLVQQERSMALRPYDVLSGVLENRMGDVNDIVQSGIQGWQGMVDAGTTRLGTAQSMLATALQSYLAATGQQEAADQLGFQIAQAKESSRQFGISSGQEQQKINNQVDQFNRELALRRSTSGKDPKDTSLITQSAWDKVAELAGGDPAKAWSIIHQNEATWGAAGINMNNIWANYKAMGGSSSAPKASTSGGGFLSGLFNGNSNYSNTQMDLGTGKITGNPVPISNVLKPGDPDYVNFGSISGYYPRGY